MTFTPEQKAELAKPLNRAHVKPPAPGKYGEYLEGWRAIDEANRIFGFDGWSSETDEIRMVSERQVMMGRNRDKEGWAVAYVARCRIRVANVTREGVGAGTGIDADLGMAHESAIKEAETDSRKRALMTFGNPFGLALYDKSKANVSDTSKPPPPASAKPGGVSDTGLGATITDAQATIIKAEAVIAGVPVASILKRYNIADLRQLPDSEAEAVREGIRLTLEQKAKANA